MTLGEKIRILRQEKGLSQKELADQINKSTGDIALWESDETIPAIADIAKLSSTLDVTTDYFIFDNVENEENQQQLRNDFISDTGSNSETSKKWAPKKKLTVFVSIGTLLVVMISILAYLLLLPFSKNTLAIEKSTSSVVKIYCYDYFGEASGTGSGFIAFDDQTIVTNYHVMEQAYTCKISTDEDKTYEVESILAYSKEHDVAIIKLEESTGLKVLQLGNSEKIKKGETVTAIGSPLGIKNTVSQGVLSGRLMEGNMDVLQFTAAISSGSSGGALFDENGKVIGVTYASLVEGQNLNLAIPIEKVIALMEQESVRAESYASSQIYNEAHPYVKFLDEFPNVEMVTFEDLKQSPQKYDGKMVAIDTYISSENTYWYYFSNKENISGDNDYDGSLFTKSGTIIPYEEVPVMEAVKRDYLLTTDEFEIGDNVFIIGEFHYVKGEKDAPDPLSKVESAFVMTKVICKK